MLDIHLTGGQSGYDIVEKYIRTYWEIHPICDVIVAIGVSYDGKDYDTTNEIVTTDSYGTVIFDNDWWEGQEHIQIMGIQDVDEVTISENFPSEFYCNSYRAERNYAGGIGICIGTKECEACSCNGEKRKCNFYPALKAKAEQLYSATRKNNTSYNGKEVARMRTLRARSDKELGICLRMLYAERVGYRVSVVENNKHKIEFEVRVDVDEALADVLEERFRILVS